MTGRPGLAKQSNRRVVFADFRAGRPENLYAKIATRLQRLAQEILKHDGKLGADTAAFARSMAVKLRAEGWRITGDAEAALNDYLAQMTAAVRVGITTAAVVGTGLPVTAARMQSKVVLDLAEAAFNKQWPDGLTLSDRLWRWDKATRDGVQGQLQAGIKQGQAVGKTVMAMQRAIEQTHGDARFKLVSSHHDQWVEELHQSAQLLIHSPEMKAEWQKVVDDAEARIDGLSRTGSRNAAERLLSQIKLAMKNGNEALLDKAVKWFVYDKQLYHLQRIVRTEMATAAHVAVIESVAHDDTIIGFQWRLSASHPATDICDYYANIEMGLGKGVFTKETVPHTKAHPQCMCLLIPRVTPIKQQGSKNYADFIQNTSQERRDAMLPKWAQEAVAGGVPLAKLVRKDGLGLVAKKDAGALLANQAIDAVYQAAKSGGDYAKFYGRYQHEYLPRLHRAVKSFDEVIAEHEAWIKNPGLKFGDNVPADVVQRCVADKWPRDIARNQAYKAIIKGIIKERKK